MLYCALGAIADAQAVNKPYCTGCSSGHCYDICSVRLPTCKRVLQKSRQDRYTLAKHYEATLTCIAQDVEEETFFECI